MRACYYVPKFPALGLFLTRISWTDQVDVHCNRVTAKSDMMNMSRHAPCASKLIYGV